MPALSHLRLASRLRRIAVSAAVLLCLLAVGPAVGVVSAHAELISTTPSDDEVTAELPSVVELTFDEPVALSSGGITVLGPSGAPVQDGQPETSDSGLTVTQALAEPDGATTGTYTVSYRVLSADGHVIAGSYLFHVGERSGAAAAAEPDDTRLARAVSVLGRWLALAGALLAGGVLAMALWVDRTDPDRTGRRAVSAGLIRSQRLLTPAALAVLFGSALALFGAAIDLSGGSISDGLVGLDDVLGSGRTGAVAGLRVLVALVLLLAVAGGPILRRAPWLAAVAVLAALALPSLGGHPATASPAAPAVAADVVHVLSAAAWVGGLAVLVLTWDGSRGRLGRFSSMALVAAPLVLMTGAVSAWLQIGSPGQVLDSDYGRLVLAKVVGGLFMLAAGILHRRRLTPRQQPHAGDGLAAAPAGLRTTMAAQVLVGIGVLAVTAVLVGTPPPTGTESKTTGGGSSEVRTYEATAGGTQVRMQVSPGRAGPNAIHLYYSDPDGSPAAVDAAELTVASDGVEPRKVPMTPITPDHATASGVQLTPGLWTFDLTVVAGGVPAETAMQVEIR